MSADRPELVVVHVRDELNPSLSKRHAVSYASPAQPLEQARLLAGLLLGCAQAPSDGTQWRRPIAGGQRTVTIGPGFDRGPGQQLT